MLEQMPKGEEFEIWPPHITIVPWFLVGDEALLDKTLRSIANKFTEFLAKAGQIEEWGKKEKFRVQKIDDDGELHQLHWNVFQDLQKNGFNIHQKEFLGEKYVPHVTLRNRKSKDELTKGSEIYIDSFTLVKQLRLKGSGRMIKSVVRDYELQ
jgi:2'-5' RNA ligase